MKSKETLLGAIVLVLVLAGGYWVRTARQAPATLSDGAPSTPSSPGPGAAPDGASRPAGTQAGDLALADITTADASEDIAGLTVTVSVTPRPPVAFAKQRFRVRIEAAGAPATLDDGVIAFDMTMPMGDHRYTLVAATDGWHEAEVVLPHCPTGDARWHATQHMVDRFCRPDSILRGTWQIGLVFL